MPSCAAGIHLYENDKHGNVVLYIRLKYFQKLTEILELLKKFAIYNMFLADAEAASRDDGSGWVLLFDCTGNYHPFQLDIGSLIQFRYVCRQLRRRDGQLREQHAEKLFPERATIRFDTQLAVVDECAENAGKLSPISHSTRFTNYT